MCKFCTDCITFNFAFLKQWITGNAAAFEKHRKCHLRMRMWCEWWHREFRKLLFWFCTLKCPHSGDRIQIKTLSMRSKFCTAGNTLSQLAIILKINQIWAKNKENQNIKDPWLLIKSPTRCKFLKLLKCWRLLSWIQSSICKLGLNQAINSFNFSFKPVSITQILLRKITNDFLSLKLH